MNHSLTIATYYHNRKSRFTANIHIFVRNINLIYVHTTLEHDKRRKVHMPNAKQYVDQSMSSVQNTVDSLQQALNTVEKEDNKNKIQQAISSLQSVQQQLSNYQD
jgi:hypothetical protein